MLSVQVTAHLKTWQFSCTTLIHMPVTNVRRFVTKHQRRYQIAQPSHHKFVRISLSDVTLKKNHHRFYDIRKVALSLCQRKQNEIGFEHISKTVLPEEGMRMPGRECYDLNDR